MGIEVQCQRCGKSISIKSENLPSDLKIDIPECSCDKQRIRECRVVIGLQLLLIGFLIGLIVGRALGSW